MKLALAALISVLAVVSTGVSVWALHNKPMNHDEAHTRLWASGHSRSDVFKVLAGGNPVEAAKLRPLLNRDDRSFSFKEIIRNTYFEDHNHPPGYIFILDLWERLFGDSLFTDRMLSSLARPFAIAFLGWLTFEIYDSMLAALFACALLLVSPFELRLSIVARDYMLFLAVFSLAAASLLAYFKRPKRVFLITYFFTAFLAANISLLAVLLVVPVIFKVWKILQAKEMGPGEKVWLYIVALPLVLFFLWTFPQLSWVINGLGPALTSESKSFIYLCQSVGKNFTQVFYDLNDVNLLLKAYSLPVVTLIFALIAVAIDFSWKDYKRESRVLIVVAAANFLPYFFADWIYGSTFYSTDRHLLLAHTALILLVARRLQVWVQSPELKLRNLGYASFVTLISVGAASFGVVAAADNWQQKTISYSNKEIVQALNSETSPVLISDLDGTHLGNILAMSTELKPNTHIILERDYSLNNLKRNKQEGVHYFYFDPSQEAQKNFAAMNLRLSPMQSQSSLWRLE